MSNVWEEGELYVGEEIGAGTAEDWGLIGSRIRRLFNYRFKYMLSHAVQIAFFNKAQSQYHKRVHILLIHTTLDYWYSYK